MSDAPGGKFPRPTPVVRMTPPHLPAATKLPPPEQRTALAFSVELVLAVLQAAGAIDEPTRREAITKEHAQRGRILKERGGGKVGGPRYVVSPIELVASLALRDPSGTVLDEDRITDLVGRGIGVPTRKIDPLKLDMPLITRTVSRAYARTHACLPLQKVGDALELAVANPWDRELAENLRHLVGAEIRPVLCSKSDILRAITDVYGFKTSVTAALTEQGTGSSVDVGNLEQLVKLSDHESLEADDRPVINAVEYLLHYAYDQRASDIHIEPKRERSQIRLRIDGVLHDIYSIPKAVHAPMVARLKLLARMDIAEKRRPQDGRIKTSRNGREVELRVSTVPVAFGEKLVVRIFDPQVLLQDLAEVGFYPEEQQVFETWIAQPHGLILVTGPTGSGKTTTLYSALRVLAQPDVNVVTIEDPVEMVHEPFNQINIQTAIDLTFAQALRHVLRQDPDVIMVGEIRDPETAQNAVQAALTGHLVLSTLHTNDAASAVVRLRDLGVAPFLVANTLVGVMAQRLVRKVCSHCAQEVPLSADELASLGVVHAEDHVGKVRGRRGAGCAKCRGTGYFGRSGIFELLDVDPRMRKLVAEGADSHAISDLARSSGMRSLRDHALRKLGDGVTTFEEIVRATAEVL
jgi:general secretion pathway protein E